jgi:phage terminase large subunit GpA-like protein
MTMGAAERLPDFLLPCGYLELVDAFGDGLTPSPPVVVSEWAQKYRRLSSKESPKPGRWDNELVPFAVEIMDVLSPMHPARRVVYQKSTQIAGTETGNNWVGCVIATQRCPMMVVEPTSTLAERWSKQRLASMIDATPVLWEKIKPARSRDSGNTTLLKEWPGGLLIIAGANSAADLRSMPARYLFADEVDAYPVDLDGEGDPLSLAEARLGTFDDRKVFICSTPTIESLSVVHKEYQASDKRRYYVPCPHCGHEQPLEWDHLSWPDGEPHKAAYRCDAEDCGCLIEESHKPAMLAAGRWVAENPAGWTEQRPEAGAIGFAINALYSPIGLGARWGELAAEWERKKADPLLVKTFTNTKLGICVADPEEKLDWEELKHRAEPYDLRTIPPGALVLTAGVDVQGDRWAIVILGHGRDAHRWILDWIELPGDPTNANDWRILDDYLSEPIINSYGVPMRLSAVCIDSGYLQDDVVNFTRLREGRGIFAIKGASQRGKAVIGRPSKVDVTWRGVVHKQGAKQWQVGEDTAKMQLFQMLKADRRADSHESRRIHFSHKLDDSFYSQFTAEVYDPNKGKWIKTRQRNEALDCYVYAVAAAMHPKIQLHRWTDARWARQESLVQPSNGDLFSAPAAASPAGAAPREKTGKRPPKRPTAQGYAPDGWGL